MQTLPPFSRAAVFHSPGERLEITRFPVRTPQGGEVVVRILCTTLCGSDLHSRFGRRPSPAPCILGHEMVGEICAAGPDGALDHSGQSLSAGDRVTWSMVWSCGACHYCARGLRQKCEKLVKFGHEPVQPGRELSGGLAEYCVLPTGTSIFRVPDNLPDEVASPANCATATVAAVCRTAGSLAGHTAVVYGAGMLGLTACAMVAEAGATAVLAIEKDAQRAALAPLFGAHLVLDGNLPARSLREAVLALTDGRGADMVFDFTGMPEAMESGFELLGIGGRFLLAGATFPSRAMQLPAEQLVRRLIRVEGVYNYLPEDLNAALQFLASSLGRYPFQRLTERRFGLEDADAAFHLAEADRPPRVAVMPNGP